MAESIYKRIERALDTWLRENGFTYFSERALLDAAPANRRMCVAHVIADTNGMHADNKPRACYYRVQIDILCDEAEQANLYDWYIAAERELYGTTGALRQGNYRMEFDDVSRYAWIHQDYLIKEVLTDGSVR